MSRRRDEKKKRRNEGRTGERRRMREGRVRKEVVRRKTCAYKHTLDLHLLGFCPPRVARGPAVQLSL